MNAIIKNLFILALLSTVFVGCKMGLEPPPAYTACDVTEIKFEVRGEIVLKKYVGDPLKGDYREWFETTAYFRPVNSIAIDISNNTISAKLPTLVSDTIAVNPSKIVCTANISYGAKISPLAGSPALGTIADFSVLRMYEVTAADGKTKKTWTFEVKQ